MKLYGMYFFQNHDNISHACLRDGVIVLDLYSYEYSYEYFLSNRTHTRVQSKV